ERHREAQAREAASQESRPCGERARQREEEARAAHEVQVEGKEPADDRDEEDAAPDAAHDRDDPHEERRREEDERPRPPGERARVGGGGGERDAGRRRERGGRGEAGERAQAQRGPYASRAPTPRVRRAGAAGCAAAILPRRSFANLRNALTGREWMRSRG